ncbi:MAG: hybrid sensor histidine kinase/response regulator [Flammeovirgaceae bacterium]
MTTILLVDDQLHYIQSLKKLLQEHQYYVLIANNAELAMEIADSYRPKAIIMDWDMPGVNGIEATKRLKRNPNTEDIPIIIASGVMTTPEHLKVALDAGALDYIRKPIDGVELLARLQTALRVSAYVQRLHEKNKNLEMSNQTQDRLMAIISHDLQSPLHSLQSSLIIAKKIGEHGISQQEFFSILNQIEQEFSSVIGLINNLLFWALNRQEAFVYQAEVLPLHELLADAVKLGKNAAEKKQIVLSAKYPPYLLANTDGNMLRFILRNLISNAIKFTPTGGNIEVTCQVDREDLYISVKDSGIGLSQEQQKSLFIAIDPHKVTSDTFGRRGTGLGLAVASEFAQKMGGLLSIESKLGAGSKFTLQLSDSILECKIDKLSINRSI